MATNSTMPSWRSWSLPTKLTVGIGLLVATVMVAALYLPR